MRTVCVELVALALLSGHALASEARPLLQANQSAAWTVTFRITGGVAGFDREVTVSAAGGATAVDRRRRIERTDRVPDSELSTIASLLPGVEPRNRDRPGSCGDCLAYTIDVQRNGRLITAHVDDMSLAASRLEPVVTALNRLLGRMLSASR
jgi:hypothetical protein